MAKKQIDESFIQLVTKHQGIIHKICGIYCDTSTDRQDLFQEILLQIWKSYPSFKGQSKISTWMYRIGLNTAISAFRKNSRKPKEQQLSLHEYQIAEAPLDTEMEERLKMLHHSINQLNKVEKAIIMLFLEEHSYADIANIMGISESNVGVKLHRIKSKLKKMMVK